MKTKIDRVLPSSQQINIPMHRKPGVANASGIVYYVLCITCIVLYIIVFYMTAFLCTAMYGTMYNTVVDCAVQLQVTALCFTT